MQFTTTAIVALLGAAASLVTARPTDDPSFEVVFNTYGNGDHACADANFQTSVVVTSNNGTCEAVPAHTSSIYVRVPAYSTGVQGCEATFYAGETCDEALTGMSITNGFAQCVGATGTDQDFGSVRITC